MKNVVTKLGQFKYTLTGDAIDFTARTKKAITEKLVETTELSLDAIKEFMKTVVEENVAYEIEIAPVSVVEEKVSLTDLERNLLNEMQNDCFWENELDSVLWVCTFLDERNLDPKVYRGVMSSLVKKGIIETWNTEDGEPDYQVIALTEEGKALYEKEFLKVEEKVEETPVTVEAEEKIEETPVTIEAEEKVEETPEVETIEVAPKSTPALKTSKKIKLTKDEFEVLCVSNFARTKENYKTTHIDVTGKTPDMRTVSCYMIGLRKKGLIDGFKPTPEGVSFMVDNGVTGDFDSVNKAVENFQPTRKADTSNVTPIKDKEQYFKALADNNITWETHEHSAINLMRARMAAKKAGFDFTC